MRRAGDSQALPGYVSLHLHAHIGFEHQGVRRAGDSQALPGYVSLHLHAHIGFEV